MPIANSILIHISSTVSKNKINYSLASPCLFNYAPLPLLTFRPTPPKSTECRYVRQHLDSSTSNLPRPIETKLLVIKDTEPLGSVERCRIESNSCCNFNGNSLASFARCWRSIFDLS